MKIYLYFLLSTLLCLACASNNQEQNQDVKQTDKGLGEQPEELPLCQIEAVESCEVESVGDTETVYRCPQCSVDVECPDCAKKGCEDCADDICRCRLKNRPSKESERSH